MTDRIRYPLFWCLSVDSRAKLIQLQYMTYGNILEIPAPPDHARGPWQAVWHESLEEIDRLLRLPPQVGRGY